MSIKAVVLYLDYRFKLRQEEILYRSITGEYMGILASGRRCEEPVSYIKGYKEIHGLHEEKDKRTAEEIISDTFKKHGITVIKGR